MQICMQEYITSQKEGGSHLCPLTPLKSAIVRKRKRAARVAKRREGRGRGGGRGGEGRGGEEDGRRGGEELKLTVGRTR